MKKSVMALSVTALISFGNIASAAGDVEKGRTAYSGTCLACHGAAGEGGVGPKLAGQSAKKIAMDLTKYKEGKTIGPLTAMMAPQATNLSKADIANLAAYISKMK